MPDTPCRAPGQLMTIVPGIFATTFCVLAQGHAGPHALLPDGPLQAFLMAPTGGGRP